ncbi:hypothetical protein RFI_32531 [Reticulomyxa filosa]|uniref:Uncharacterized protein n=1 Tax=Reticulomyxa filosa TaxID=46433 RepID=X6LW11_RETFI|nr:hypothetical protein RFI_32531 [Reticulomyxa filosa]|eukprot:ETO04865.1 hypothetical protein RFI_32531 [Reticulomyxa filosa]
MERNRKKWLKSKRLRKSELFGDDSNNNNTTTVITIAMEQRVIVRWTEDLMRNQAVGFSVNVTSRMKVAKVKKNGQEQQLGLKQGDIMICIDEEDKRDSQSHGVPIFVKETDYTSKYLKGRDESEDEEKADKPKGMQVKIHTHCIKINDKLDGQNRQQIYTCWNIPFERFRRPTKENCIMLSKFIVLRTIVRTMKDEEIRTDIIPMLYCQVESLRLPIAACLSMMLKTITYLMDVFKKGMIVTNKNHKMTAAGLTETRVTEMKN